jgi:hypothetical protein
MLDKAQNFDHDYKYFNFVSIHIRFFNKRGVLVIYKGEWKDNIKIHIKEVVWMNFESFTRFGVGSSSRSSSSSSRRRRTAAAAAVPGYTRPKPQFWKMWGVGGTTSNS